MDQEVERLATDEEIQKLKQTQTKTEAKPPVQAEPPLPSTNRDDKAQALWNRGYDAFRRGRRVAARDFYQRAISIDPNYYAALNSLGRMAVEEGRAEEGIAFYERALESNPTYGPALYNMVLAVARSGDVNKTKAAWTKATAADPSYKARGKARNRVAYELKVSVDQFPLPR